MGFPAYHASIPESTKFYLVEWVKGTLVRPLERTYPPRWTVQLDRGGYDCAIVSQITPINPQPIKSELEIPPSDESEEDTKISKHEDTKKTIAHSELEKEITALKKQLAQLQQENEILKKDLAQAKQVIRRAKDISPLMRISLKRVLRLAKDACMDVRRTVGGWILKMGEKARKFRRLADIWDILSQDNWYLEDIFPPDKLIAIDLIQPPKLRKPPTLPDKKTRPLMHPSDVMRRTMFLVQSG